MKEREAFRISSQRVTQSELSLRNISPLVEGRGNEPFSEMATKIQIQSDRCLNEGSGNEEREEEMNF